MGRVPREHSVERGEDSGLAAALDQMEDAQATGPDEYVVDLYQREPPMTLELAFEAGGCWC